LKKILVFICLQLTLFADMSVEDAWQNIEQKNNGMKASQNDVNIAKLKRDSAKSMYLPSVSLIGNYTHLNDNMKVEDTISLPILPTPIPFKADLSEQDIFLADLELLWPLYTGGKIDATQDIYKAQTDEAKAHSEIKKDEEFLKLVKYYYGLVVSKSLYITRQETQKALQIHFENAKKLKDAGQIANVELLNAKVKLDAAKIETTKAKHKYEIAVTALASLVKQKIKPSSKLFVNEILKDEYYYVNETQNNYAGIKVYDAKEKQSLALVNIKKAAWHPQVMGYANYNLYKDESILSQSLPNWFAGVVVKIDLLQRKDRGEDVEAAQLLNAKVKNLRKEALENLALLVEKTYKEMLSYKEEFFSLDSSIALCKENVRLRKISFKEGLSTSVELVDAQMFLLAAKTKKLNAAYNYVQKLSQLCVLSGDRKKFFEFIGEGKKIK
jgi:outer membrane protein TolC